MAIGSEFSANVAALAAAIACSSLGSTDGRASSVSFPSIVITSLSPSAKSSEIPAETSSKTGSGARSTGVRAASASRGYFAFSGSILRFGSVNAGSLNAALHFTANLSRATLGRASVNLSRPNRAGPHANLFA